MSRSRRLLVFVLAWLIATALCLVLVDRAASSYSFAHHLRRFALFDRLTHLVDPLQALADLGLAGAAIARIGFGWQPRRAGRTFLAACLALILAYAIKESLKLAFGRTWPETWQPHSPSWITDHAWGFHFFHGGTGYASFPSGHTTQMAALAGVLWQRVRPLRWLGVLLTLAVMTGLWGADYHFVGDMVAGAFLGVATACGVLAFFPEDRPPA